jgi:hypothetical protein
VHARVAPSSAAPQPQLLMPQSLKALVDTLLAREDAVHAQLNAALMQQAQLQTRVSVSQRELLAFQPLLSELAHSRAQTSAHLRGTYLDPGVDALLSSAHTARMQALEQVRELQEKMKADGYVHDSVTGRKLLNRAKELKAENLKFAQDVRKSVVDGTRGEQPMDAKFVASPVAHSCVVSPFCCGSSLPAVVPRCCKLIIAWPSWRRS